MSNDFSPINNPESESPMFAGTPSWERGKKRRGFGSRAPAEPRSFAPEYAPEPGDPVQTRPATLAEDARVHEARMDTVDPTDTAFASGGTFADRTRRKGNGAAPILIVAGVILVGGLAAAGWYATQKGVGIAELTPGTAATTTTTQVASTAPAGDQTAAPPPAAPAEAAPPTAAAPAAKHTVTSTTTRTPRGAVSHTTVTHARPAADAAANASATAPVRPAPSPVAPPTAAAPPAPLVLTIPQTQAAPPAPAETPAPPTTTQAPPPTQTPPN